MNPNNMNNNKLLFIRGSINNENTNLNDIFVLDLFKKKCYSLTNDLSLKSNIWDIEFCNVLVVSNINQKWIQSFIQQPLKYNNNNILFRFGGSIVKNNECTNNVDGLLINSNKWIKTFRNLKKKRFGATSCYSKKYGIFVIGGKHNQELESNVVEYWDIFNNNNNKAKLYNNYVFFFFVFFVECCFVFYISYYLFKYFLL